MTKGQLLFKVRSPDIAQAFSDYRQAVADETLAKAQLARAKDLLEKGAIAKKDEEVAQDADDKAKVTWRPRRSICGCWARTPDHPSSIVEIHAPVSGVITDQQVTAAAGVKTLDIRPICSRFPICRTCGLSATCTRTTCRSSTWASTPIFT